VVTQAVPPLPPIELVSNGNDEEDDVAWEACHLAMARRNSLTTIVTDVWEKAKEARDTAEEEWDVRRAKAWLHHRRLLRQRVGPLR
jgi:hypothetical protein